MRRDLPPARPAADTDRALFFELETAAFSMKNNLHTVRTVQFVTVVGMILNIVLVLAKAAGGIFFYSQALLADAVHSLSDLVTDLAVIFGRHLPQEWSRLE